MLVLVLVLRTTITLLLLLAIIYHLSLAHHNKICALLKAISYIYDASY